MTDVQTLLTYLASSPATPPALLDHLVAHTVHTLPTGDRTARGANITVRAALAKNPNVPDEHVRALLDLPVSDGRTRVLYGLMDRPGMTGARLVELIDGDHSATTLQAALKNVPDPDGTLARHAYTHATGTMVWSELVRPARPEDLRRAACLDLAAHPKTLPAHAIANVIRVARERLAHASTPQEHAAAVTFVDDLIATSTPIAEDASAPGGAVRSHMLLTGGLAGLDREYNPPQHGTKAWLKHPSTPIADVIAWAQAAGTVAAWTAAFMHSPDPGGDLAGPASRQFPGDPNLAIRVLMSNTTSQAAKQAAVRVLLSTPTHHDQLNRFLYGVLLHADRQFAVDVAAADPADSNHLYNLMRRDDLTSDDLDAVEAARARATDGRVPRTTWGMWLATYPTATAAQRAHGRLLASTAPDSTAPYLVQLAAQNAPLCDLLTDLDPLTNPASPARVGGRLPLTLLDDHVFANLVGVRWLLGESVIAHLPEQFGPDAAATLTALAHEFTGSLADLLDTTAAIVA